MSLVALVAIHWQLLELEFSFTPSGINNYLSSYATYKALFTGTIATCAAYFGLLRVKVSEDANREKIKQDYFNEWKITFQVRSSEVERKDGRMIGELTKVRRALFNDLYSLKFNIQNKEELTKVFDKHIKPLVDFFETQNDRHVNLGGVYPDDQYSYSFDSFRFIFMGMTENYYDNIVQDLKELYLSGLNENRNIDAQMYNSAVLVV
ncbi:hypothetical protein [Reichenbachiella versicolor]|uniref:hypothetical protein n=1 Tax=Reichenbachiella versicolor TaxID=1821036 RepID=UPI000D6EA679|nr:hypothetical protein [Reichenbachiella versicolor]